ncbi:MAG: MFS transporter [Thermoplasmata archaeon]|nr:MFS transporter [Thermoplasmata archaeon]
MLNERQRKLILITTSLASFLTPFSSSVITFAVPRIGEIFRANFFTVVWVPLAYLIPLPSLMILFGRLSDIYGRVKLFRLGFIIFLISMTLIIFSVNIYMLISLVFLAGIGGALIGTNATAIISHVYPANKRGGALGINAMSVYLGLTFSPFLGGVLIQFFDWQSVFLVTIPIVITALLISIFSLRDIDFKNKKENLDVMGAVIFTSSIISIVLYLSFSEIYGWFSMIFLLILGITLLILFIFYERKVKEPLIDISLFTKNRTFAASNISAFLNYISTYSIVFIFSIYLQVFLKYSPFQAGMVLVADPIFMVIFSPISGRLADKYGSRIMASLGMTVIGISFLILSWIKITNVYDIIIPLSFIGIGFGFFTAPNTNSVMGSVPRERFGIASGTLGTMRFTGQILSISVASAILSNALPRKILLGIFTGIMQSASVVYLNEFISGFKIAMLFSGLMSLLGAYASLLRNKNA